MKHDHQQERISDDEFDRIVGMFCMGDLTPGEFRRTLMHQGVNEHEIESLIRQFTEET